MFDFKNKIFVHRDDMVYYIDNGKCELKLFYNVEIGEKVALFKGYSSGQLYIYGKKTEFGILHKDFEIDANSSVIDGFNLYDRILLARQRKNKLNKILQNGK